MTHHARHHALVARRLLALAALFALAACGGGGSSTTLPKITVPPPVPPASGKLQPTNFTLIVGASATSTAKAAAAGTRAGMRPSYVPASSKSITITLNTVDGNPPPSGLTTSVTTNLTSCSPSCTVPGPSAPPGSDVFTLTVYDATGGTGNALSTASPTLAIILGQANSNTITLLGIPKSFTFGTVPSGTAGTPFGSGGVALPLTVKDADGNTITGVYNTAVTVTDSDTSSLALASGLAVSGGSAASSVSVASSTADATLKLTYGGQAILPATLTASAAGAINATATFTPTRNAIVYTGPTNGSGNPEIDLYATSGTGSSAGFTATEVGWTNAPYSQAITATEASGCSSIATTAATSGSAFTTTVASSPAAGTCTLTLTDVSGGSTAVPVTLTYTSSGFGVQ
ncbi:MAG: hypothetical protein ACYDA5_09635 [Vulcanimicrobiaceae bacterium]